MYILRIVSANLKTNKIYHCYHVRISELVEKGLCQSVSKESNQS